ncbi:MAG TPA: extracellular solute-binding protein [Candidatus Limnocylindrales bacterium]
MARAALAAVLVIVASACGDAQPSQSNRRSASPGASTGAAGSSRPAGSPDPITELAAAARAEGTLTTIGLPHDWCGYGDALETFSSRYGITVHELNQDAGFADQVKAIRTSKDAPGPDAPDVVDIGRSFAAKAKTDKLLAPYKVATWASIPPATKDPSGYWTGDYFGVLAFETNASAIANPPADWADLLDPDQSLLLALSGDPRVSDQAIQTVYAAALANGGSLTNPQAGLTYFQKLHKAGRLSPRIADSGSIDAGITPITVRWTYNGFAHRDQTAGNPEIDVTIPASGRLGSYYVQAISAFAPHPNAARLWLEFLYSDDGQGVWLKGHCLPVRLDDLLANDAIPADVLAEVPDVEGTVFPTLDQLNAASTLITSRWNAVVGADIK